MPCLCERPRPFASAHSVRHGPECSAEQLCCTRVQRCCRNTIARNIHPSISPLAARLGGASEHKKIKKKAKHTHTHIKLMRREETNQRQRGPMRQCVLSCDLPRFFFRALPLWLVMERKRLGKNPAECLFPPPPKTQRFAMGGASSVHTPIGNPSAAAWGSLQGQLKDCTCLLRFETWHLGVVRFGRRGVM